jgi:hypothetical protein
MFLKYLIANIVFVSLNGYEKLDGNSWLILYRDGKTTARLEVLTNPKSYAQNCITNFKDVSNYVAHPDLRADVDLVGCYGLPIDFDTTLNQTSTAEQCSELTGEIKKIAWHEADAFDWGRVQSENLYDYMCMANSDGDYFSDRLEGLCDRFADLDCDNREENKELSRR